MAIKSVTLKSSQITSQDSHKMMVSKWKVSGSGFFGYSKTYHIIVLKGFKPGWIASSSFTFAYVTDKLPRKQDLSKSTLHINNDTKTEVLKDKNNSIICSYAQEDKVDLGFKIDDAEFEKTDRISEELITNLGNFLKNHLENLPKKPTDGKLEASPPKAADEKALATVAKKAESTDAEKPKGLIRTYASALFGRVTSLGSKIASYATCDRVGFLITTIVVATFWAYLDRDIDPTIQTTL